MKKILTFCFLSFLSVFSYSTDFKLLSTLNPEKKTLFGLSQPLFLSKKNNCSLNLFVGFKGTDYLTSINKPKYGRNGNFREATFGLTADYRVFSYREVNLGLWGGYLASKTSLNLPTQGRFNWGVSVYTKW